MGHDWKQKRIVLILVLVLLPAGACVRKNLHGNPTEETQVAEHPMDIYGRAGTGAFYAPFHFSVDPMERLLLVNIEKDPDRLYVAFEPQWVDDDKTGHGLLVIAYRVDGFVDVYYEPGLSMAHKDFGIVGKGLAQQVETVFERAVFEIGRLGLATDIAFRDREGRAIEVRILEAGPKPPRPFSLLAPLGSAAEHPPSMPLFFVHDFYFVRKKGTEVHIAVDGRTHKPDGFPMPMDGTRIYFTRYSGAPLIVAWNESFHGPVEAHGPVGALHRVGDTEYELVHRDDHVEIAAMRAGSGPRSVTITFEPAVPDIPALRDGVSVEGRFEVVSEPPAGSVDGVYRIDRQGDEVVLRIHPDGGWKPDADRWMVGLIYRMAAIFREWPKTYVWTGRMALDGDEGPTLEAGWTRVPKGTVLTGDGHP